MSRCLRPCELALTLTLVSAALAAAPAQGQPACDATTMTGSLGAAELVTQVHDLEADVRTLLAQVRSLAVAGDALPDDLVEQATVVRQRLDHIGDLIKAAGAGAGAAGTKLDAVEGLVYNLELAASGAADPALLPDLGINADAHRVPTRAQGPANDDCAAATSVGNGVYTGTTAGATQDGEAACGASMRTADVWFRFVAPSSELVVMSTIGSSYDTVLSVHSACPGTMDNQIACNDDDAGLQSSLGIQAVVGSEYLVRLSGVNGATGAYQLTVGNGSEITGTVTDAVSGVPLAGECVKRYDLTGYYQERDYTDSTGVYRFTSILPGASYIATYSSDPHIDEVYDDVKCLGPGGACSPTSGTPIITAEIGTPPVTADIALDLGGTLEGHVRDSSGDGIDPALIWLYSLDTSATLRHANPDASGHWSATGLPAGAYAVLARSDLHIDELYDDVPCEGGVPVGCSEADGDPVTVELNATTSGIDCVLDRLGVISGTVVNGSTGAPVEDATVEVWYPDGKLATWVKTDSAGVYMVGGLADGSYHVTAERSGYFAELYDDVRCPGGLPHGCTQSDGTAIAAATESTVSGIDFALDPLGSVSGQVRERGSGAPVSYASIYFWDASEKAARSVTSSSDGTYVATNLSPGSYHATARATGFLDQLYEGIPCPDGPPEGCSLDSGAIITVNTGEETTGIDFDLDTGGSIAGRLSEAPSGNPVAQAAVKLWRDSSPVMDALSWTDENGDYAFTVLGPGTYFVSTATSSVWIDELYDNVPCPTGAPEACDPRSGTPIQVGLNQDVTAIDFTLNRMGSIAGTVTASDTSEPLAYVSVSVRNAIAEVVGSTSTDGSGNYEVGGLLSGTYFVVADPLSPYLGELYAGIPCAGGAPLGCNPILGTPIQVAMFETTAGVDFQLPRGGSISGDISYADGEPGLFIGVDIWDANGDFVMQTNTEFDSHYSAYGLVAGTYHVSTDLAGDGDQLYDGLPCPQGVPEGCDPTTGTPIPVALGADVAGIDFVIQQPSQDGSITGTITAVATRLPISNVNVAAYDSDGHRKSSTTSNPNGFYELGHLQPGSYFVVTDSSHYRNELFDDLPCDATCSPTTGTPVTVAEHATTRHVDFALNGYGTINARLIDEVTGAGVYPGRWELRDAAGVLVATGITDRPGFFTIGGLDAGDYYLASIGNQSHRDELYEDVPCPGGVGFGCLLEDGSPITVALDQTVEGIVMALDSGGRIEGTVSSELPGQAMGGIPMVLYDGTGALLGSTQTDSTGAYTFGKLDPGSFYVLGSPATTHIKEVYDNVVCPGGPPAGCAVTDGDTVAIAGLETVTGIDLQLTRRGEIRGRVTDSVTGFGVESVAVGLHNDSGIRVRGTYTSWDGTFNLTGLEPGDYYLFAEKSGYSPVLYDDITCPGGAWIGCNPTTGTPVTVAYNSVTDGIDFTLDPGRGTLSGTVVADDTGRPILSAHVTLLDGAGSVVASAITSTAGGYEFTGLLGGSYHLLITSALGYIEELYDDIPCPRATNRGCDVTKGTPIVLPTDGSVAGLDFGLEPRLQGIRGSVTNGRTGLPLANVHIDIWDATTHELVRSLVTFDSGTYITELAVGTYVVSTDAPGELVDQVFSGVSCPAGSAFDGMCSLDQGTLITVEEGVQLQPIDFVLDLDPSVFTNGFESGNLEAWSRSVS